jgi:hypothetical protein
MDEADDHASAREGLGPAAREVEPSQVATGAARSDLDFAVVVGVEHYQHFRPLCGAISDAKSFRDWLCDEHGGGLAPDNVKLIESNAEARTPVQDEIDDILLKVLDAAEAHQGARRLYFYFSGHGAMNPRSVDDVALLLTRWQTSLARLALSIQHYSRKLRGAGLFQELAIFVDCCRSLSVSVVGVEPTITREWQYLLHSTRTFTAYATEAGKPAFEYPELDTWQGIFTQTLLAILRRDPGGVRARALKDLLEREVEEAARQRGIFQRAQVENDLAADSCFGRGGSLPILDLKFAERHGRVTLRGGDLQVLEVLELDSNVVDQRWRRPLPVGLYLVEGGGRDAILVTHDGREALHEV